MKDEMTLRIETSPELVERLAEFVGPTNLDGMTTPMSEVFYYNLLKTQPSLENPAERRYIVYAKKGPLGRRTVFTIRQLFEGMGFEIENLPLVHQWAMWDEGWSPRGDKIYPDEVCVTEGEPVVKYRWYDNKGEPDEHYLEDPVTIDVYRRLRALFDVLPWKEVEK